MTREGSDARNPTGTPSRARSAPPRRCHLADVRPGPSRSRRRASPARCAPRARRRARARHPRAPRTRRPRGSTSAAAREICSRWARSRSAKSATAPISSGVTKLGHLVPGWGWHALRRGRLTGAEICPHRCLTVASSVAGNGHLVTVPDAARGTLPGRSAGRLRRPPGAGTMRRSKLSPRQGDASPRPPVCNRSSRSRCLRANKPRRHG